MTRRIAMLALVAALAPAAAYAQARVVSLTGNVTLKRAGRDPGPLALRAAVQTGDEIVTGENSEVLVQAPDGSTVRVYPDSRVVFQERAPDLREWLHLFLGSVKVHVQRISGRPNPQSMTTPSAIIAVRGTTFDVFVDEMDATMVQVDAGLVSVAPRASPRDEVLLHAGQRTWVRPGAPPMAGSSPPGRAAGREERMSDKAFSGGSKTPPGLALKPPGRALGRKLAPGPAR